MNWKRTLLVTHFALLGLVLVSFLMKVIWGIGLRGEIDTILRFTIFLTGFGLLIKYAKPFRLPALYFSFYGLIVFVSVVWFFVRGIFWSMIISFVLVLFPPSSILNSRYQYKDFSVHENAKGLLSACCSYKVVKKEYLIFEHEIGSFSTEGISELRNMRVLQNMEGIRLIYSFDEYDSQRQNYVEKDTTILFPLYQINTQ